MQSDENNFVIFHSIGQRHITFFALKIHPLNRDKPMANAITKMCVGFPKNFLAQIIRKSAQLEPFSKMLGETDLHSASIGVAILSHSKLFANAANQAM
jgi:hypothetical protein